MTKRWCLLIAMSVAMLPGLELSRAHAQEVQVTGPLAGAPAVRRMRVYRRGRIQLQPFGAFTLQDEFSRSIFVGAQATYHFTDWLGLGVWGGYGIAGIDTGLTDQIGLQGQTTERNRLSLPQRANFTEQIGRLTWAAAVQLTFIPLRGKLALFQKLFVDTDFYLFLGVAGVGVEERADINTGEGDFAGPDVCNTASPQCDDSQVARASRVAIAPTFGVGLSLFANEFIALTFEWRGMPFAWNTSGTDEGGHSETGDDDTGGEFPDGIIDSSDRIFHLNHMFLLGVQIYLPTRAATTD